MILKYGPILMSEAMKAEGLVCLAFPFARFGNVLDCNESSCINFCFLSLTPDVCLLH